MEVAALRTMLAWLMQTEGAGAGVGTMSHFSMRSVSAMSASGETILTHDIEGSKLLRPIEALSRRDSDGRLNNRMKVTVEKRGSGVFFLTLSPSTSPGPRHL